MGELFTTVDKTDNKKSGKGIINGIEKLSKRLFEDLCEDDDSFNPKEFTLTLIDYYNKTERVYYSSYSKMIYNLDKEVTEGNLNHNIMKLVEFSGTKEFDELFPRGTSAYGNKKKIIKIIHKLWDHSQLAENQIDEIRKDKFWDNFLKEKIKIEESIKKEGQKLNKELISLVGIFTAMAFLVFGGLNSLSSILENSIKGVPILNISVVCLLWGLCVYNMIYLFMFLVAKITNNDISTNKESTSIFRRHIIYFTGNAVLLTALFVSGWLYFIKIDFRGWYTKLYHTWKSFVPPFSWLSPAIVIPVAFVFTVVIVFFVFRFIVSKNPQSKIPSNKDNLSDKNEQDRADSDKVKTDIKKADTKMSDTKKEDTRNEGTKGK